MGDANTTSNNSSPTLAISGNYSYWGYVSIANQPTAGTYTIAGVAAASSSFVNTIATNQNVTLAQVSGGTLNLTDNGVWAAGGNHVTATFAGPGLITTLGLQDSTGTLGVNVTGGTATFLPVAGVPQAYAYTGPTAVNGGVLNFFISSNTYTNSITVNSGLVNYSPNASFAYGGAFGGPITISGGTFVSGGWATGAGGNNQPLGFWNYNGAANQITINEGGTMLSAAGTQTVIDRTLTVTGGTLGAIGATPAGGSYVFRDTYGTSGNGSATNHGYYTFTSAADGTPSAITAACTLGDNVGTSNSATFNVTAGGVAGAIDLNVTGALIDPQAGVSGALIKTGNGFMLLSGSNTYSGPTMVNAGTLAVNGQLTASPVFVNPTGVLSGSGSVTTTLVNILSGGALSPGYAGAGTLTVASGSIANGSALNYTLGTNNTFLNVTGNLYLPTSGVTLNIAGGSSLLGGNYPLIGYGFLSSGGASAFSTVNVPGLPSGDSYSIVSSSNNTIDMVITAAPSVVNGVWQTGSGSWSTAGNWVGNQTPGGHSGDTAVFGTVATSGGTVTLDSNQSVASLGFSNSGGASFTISASNGARSAWRTQTARRRSATAAAATRLLRRSSWPRT